MKNIAKGKERKRSGNDSLGMFAIAFVAVILLGTFSLESRDLANKLSYYEERKESLQRSIDAEMDRTKEIDALKQYMRTDEYAEQLAREKLGLVKDNEIVFIEGN